MQGRIVDYLDGDTPQLAVVVKEGTGSLQALTERGRHVKLAPRKVLVELDDRSTVEDFPEVGRDLRRRIQELVADIDTLLLWESIQSDDQGRAEHGLDVLAELYFGARQALQRSAMLRALLGDELRFARRGERFQVRSAEQVLARETALRREGERRAFREQTQRWLRRVLSTPETNEVPDEMEPVLRDLELFLLRGQRSEASSLLPDLSAEYTAKEAAYEVLIRSARLDPGSPNWLEMAGIPLEFSDEAEQAVAKLQPYEPSAAREGVGADAFTIDDDDTRDVDDAISCSLEGEALRVGIHIADVPHFVHPEDLLDSAAFERGLTVYTPTRSVPMFPERLAYDLASLNAGELRPSLSFELLFDGQGTLENWRLYRGEVKVARRLSYDVVNEIIASPQDDPLGTPLERLASLSERLLSARLAGGAVVIHRPELKLHVDGEHISLKVLRPGSGAQQLVSELMIMANRLAAEFAQAEGVPTLYRTQPPPENPNLTGLRLDYDPVRVAQVLKGMRRSRLSKHAAPHSSLGVKAYTQVTSPIRRYADLVLQRQLVAHLEGRQPPYSAGRLLQVLAGAEAAELRARRLEQRAKRYWGLEYLRRLDGEKTHDAMVVNAVPGGYISELLEFGIRGYLPAKCKRREGERVEVSIESTDPARGRLRLSQS